MMEAMSAAGGKAQSGFTLLELAVSTLIIAILVGLLAPMLILARDVSKRTICSANLKQIGVGWMLYLGDNDQFPQYTNPDEQELGPDWAYAGVRFVGEENKPVIDALRPINSYIIEDYTVDSRFSQLFHCPSDEGIYERGGPVRQSHMSVLPDQKTCYEFYGNSYKANPYLLDSTVAGIDNLARPLRVVEVEHVGPERLLLVADPVWYFATVDGDSPDRDLDASWHIDRNSGNMLALDGSVRFMDFSSGRGFTLMPRPDLNQPPTGQSHRSSPPHHQPSGRRPSS